ncbi:MAG: hypothetical protein QJR05_13000 [Thermoanaerobacterium sp.]|nr:hypothetical protein [Thermoanaerobacterium sp.]
MRTKFFYLTILIFTLFIISSCSNNSTKGSSDIQISNEFKLLDASEDVLDDSEKYSQVKAFIPNENNIEYLNIKGDKYSYIKIKNTESVIKGKIILENNTDSNMKIKSFFIQGNKIAKVKTSKSKEWKSSVLYDVEPKSSVEISIDIQWDKEGEKEITFFPLDYTSPNDRYNGGNLSTVRYFVLDDDININKDMLAKQSFQLETEINEVQNFFPIPSWIGNDNNEVEFIVKEEKLYTKTPISGLKLEPVPYDTDIDVLLIDEQGNMSTLFQNLKISKNKPTLIHLDPETLQKVNESNKKYYFILVNNRGLDILLDMKAVDLGLKPFPTTYQSIIEFYKKSDN